VAQAVRDAVTSTGRIQAVSRTPVDKREELELEPEQILESAADAKLTMENQAIAALRANTMAKLTSEDGMPWYGFQLALKGYLPEIDDRDQFAFNLVPRTLSEIFGGPQNVAWEAYTHPRTRKRWVRRKR